MSIVLFKESTHLLNTWGWIFQRICNLSHGQQTLSSPVGCTVCVCVFSREREDALNDILRLESCPYKFPSLPRFISLAELSPFNPRDQWPPSILVAPAPLELWSINTTILRQAAPPSAGSVMGRRPVLSLYTCAAGLRSVLSGLRKWANLFWQKDSLECFLLFALSVIRNCFFQTLCSYNIFFSKVILENMDSLCQI